MGTNVDAAGARLDLRWMKRAGLGGAQLFQGDLGTPDLLTHPVVYGSDAWCEAIRASVGEARSLGLGFGIATSPGWSATGGPDVQPADAMQKLVWSDTAIDQEADQPVRVPMPPSVAGPFQDVSIQSIDPHTDAVSPFYRDVAIVAIRDVGGGLPPPEARIDGAQVSATGLSDGSYADGPVLQVGQAKPVAIVYDYRSPVTVRAVSVGLPGPRGFGAPSPPDAILQASDDGHTFHDIVSLPAGGYVVRDASFAPVTARYFRLRIAAGENVAPQGMAPPIDAAALPSFAAGAPTRITEFRLFPHMRVDHAPEKAGFATLIDYFRVPTPDADAPIDPAEVIDLSGHLRADGTLDWRPPPGRWRILRFGMSPTGHRNAPAPAQATGLEVDKLSPDRLSAFIARRLDLYRTILGTPDLPAAGLTNLVSDSIEAGPQNWTAGMLEQLRTRNGYDPLPWLPALAGYVVRDSASSDRFLYDVRATIADLGADGYAAIAGEAHKAGLVYYAEALEDHRPQLGDDLAMRAPADVPMGALWLLPPDGRPNPTYAADLKGAASVAHLYGKPVVGAESFTMFGRPWAATPRDLKATADLAFAYGVNRIIVHTSPHQPFVSGHRPGVSLAPFLGQYFDRNETWAEGAKGWTDYLARTSFLLQQGRSVAQIAYFAGEEAPITGLYGDEPLPSLPPGIDFDFLDRASLLDRLSVHEGGLTTPSGASYQAIMLGGSSRMMTLAVLRRLAALASMGATVIGPPPVSSPSLVDDPATFMRERDALWRRAPEQGGVIATVDEALRRGRVRPVRRADANGGLAVAHRQTSGEEIFFLVNCSGRPFTSAVTFDVRGRTPERWDAITGERRTLPHQGVADGIRVPLQLEAGEASFVLFRDRASVGMSSTGHYEDVSSADLGTGWTVEFPKGEGHARMTWRPASAASWATAADPAIRYFSGSATYSRSIQFRGLGWGEQRWLDLGDVRSLASVRVDGRDLGQFWTPPYRIDLTHLAPGSHRIEVRVTNSWANRLIGDAGSAAPTSFVAGMAYRPGGMPQPAGILGPIRLVTRRKLP